MSFAGYCPRNCKAVEALKKVLLWAFAKNGGDCIMGVGTMKELLLKHHGVSAAKRTIQYALKRMVLDGYISRQTRWLKRADGSVKHFRSKTRPKGRLLNEQLQRGLRGLRLMAHGVFPGWRQAAQKFAAGYEGYNQNVVPHPLK